MRFAEVKHNAWEFGNRVKATTSRAIYNPAFSPNLSKNMPRPTLLVAEPEPEHALSVSEASSRNYQPVEIDNYIDSAGQCAAKSRCVT
jgi:hypothetical protein